MTSSHPFCNSDNTHFPQRWVMWAALALLCAGLIARPATAQAEKPRAPRVTLTVDAELLEKAPTPTMAQIAPYTDALVVYKYRMTKVRSGKLETDTIAVAHWAIWRGQVQRITQAQVGRQQKLELCPFADMAEQVQTVHRSELEDLDVNVPLFHDLGRSLELPPEERSRWGYGIDLTQMMPLFFDLKDQLKLVMLGDCQAWFANKAELFMAEENRTTPVAISMTQQRSGLDFQKLMVDHYLVNLPKLEWVVLTWNPRFVNTGWTEHGVQGDRFSNSTGFKHDLEQGEALWKPRGGEPLTVQQIVAQPQYTRLWNQRPYGWIYLSPDRHRFPARGEVIKAQRLLGTYAFSQERWEIFESIVKTLAERDIKLLVYTTPIHPLTAQHKVKDKTGVDEDGYRHQLELMAKLQERYPKHLFFYDLNNMGDNGLTDADFENIDHVSGSGAQKVSERVEAYRLKVEASLPR